MSTAWVHLFEQTFGDCLNHPDHRQVGRCVYCSCGRRLYQGKPMTNVELAEIRKAITEERQTG